MANEHSPAVTLLSHQMEQREKLRVLWKKDAGKLLDAHQFAFSAISSMVDRFGGKKFQTQSRNMEGRMSLTAQFIQGVDICEVSISEGLYSQAAALLKQQLETIAAVDEYENERRKEGKTPQIGRGITSGFGPIYGDLNSIAHVSQHNLARHLVIFEREELRAPSLTPQYNPELARFLYGNHVYFIIVAGSQIARVFQDLYGESFSSEEAVWHFIATSILFNEKVITLPAEARAQFPNFDFDKLFDAF